MGKSCILHHFIENKFKEDTTHTIGVEFGSKVINISNKSIKLQIWDTAGQERFRFVNSKILICVYNFVYLFKKFLL